MKITPISCPNCGASVRMDDFYGLVTCTHCETSFHIDWEEEGNGQPPEPTPVAPTPVTEFVETTFHVLGANPFAECPNCKADILRTPANEGQEVECPECQFTATMPMLAHQRAFRPKSTGSAPSIDFSFLDGH